MPTLSSAPAPDPLRAPATPRRRADDRIDRLNRLSAGKGHEAYTDIAWNDPDMEVGPTDLRLAVPSFDPLASSTWYRALSAERRALVGAWKFATSLKTGWHFENLMQQSLLHRALYLDSGSAEWRYVYHEVIEESQHTLMFNELIGRLGVPARGAPWWLRRLAEMFTPVLAKHASPAFFVLVLCGEEPIDHYQRRTLSDGVEHPLVETIIRIHVAEEARHVSFARASLERDVASLGWVRRQVLGVHAGLSFAFMARMMLHPPKEMARGLDVPHRVLLAPYKTPVGRRFLVDAVERPRRLLADLGVLTGPAAVVWRALGLGAPERRQSRASAQAAPH